jgi:hypothetical protein
MAARSTISEFNQTIRARAFQQNYDGWNYLESVHVIENAIIVPQTDLKSDADLACYLPFPVQVFNGGVYDAELRIVPSAMVDGKVALRHLPDIEPHIADTPVRLNGSWLYGGFHYRQFGHSVTESVGRLWALKKYNHPADGMIFNCFTGRARYPEETDEEVWLEKVASIARGQAFFIELLKVFGADFPVHFVSKALQIDRLIVPSQLMGLLPYGRLMGGHETYRKHIKARVQEIREALRLEAKKRIYVSRSRFKRPGPGCFFMEDILDRNFASAGFQVIYPETMPLSEQLATYASATHIVMVASSACHVAALAMTGCQNVAILSRFYRQSDQFTAQLSAMGADSVTPIDCLSGCFLPSSESARVTANIDRSLVHYAIDFEALWRVLKDHSFLEEDLADDGKSVFADRSPALCKALEDEYKVGPFSFVPRASNDPKG